MKKKKIITVIIQARTGSKRLPKKVLKKIGKFLVIEHVIKREKKSNKIEQTILATTKKSEDRILLQIAKKNNIVGFVGKSNDVLDRYYQCALKYQADPIIRITGDCPLIDWKLIDKMIGFYKKHKCDYLCNTFPPTFPDGLDVEIFSFKALKKMWKNAKLNSEQEHVTAYIRKNPRDFKIVNYANQVNLSKYRWTVDETSDLKFLRKIFSLLKPKVMITTKDILRIIKEHPKILEINNEISRNRGYVESIKQEKIAKF